MTVVDPAASATPAPESAPAEIAPEAVAPEAAPETDLDPFAPVADGAEPDLFPRDYVEKLRGEGAKYRTRARDAETKIADLEPLAGVFEGWEPEQVEGWKTFLGQAQENPEGALQALMQEGFGYDRETAQAALDQIYEAAGETPPAPVAPGDPDDPNRPMTRAEYDAEKAREADEADMTQRVSEVTQQAKELLGITAEIAPGSQDEYRYQRLLHLAANRSDTDLSKAHEALVAEEKAIVQKHLAQMAEEADGSPAAPGGPLSPGVADGQPRGWKETDAAATAFLQTRSS